MRQCIRDESCDNNHENNCDHHNDIPNHDNIDHHHDDYDDDNDKAISKVNMNSCRELLSRYPSAIVNKL